ncbi:MAG: hypothetical protein Q8942_04420 [Bacillota bacterium]|nr:hypothetical protein [Bacillota bacterium]
MAFKLAVSPASVGGGGDSFNLDEKVIKAVTYKTDTPDDSNARSHDVGAILEIRGNLLQAAEEDTKKMAKWSLESALPYKNVVITQTAGSFVMREYTFTEGFVVDYTEEFSESEGEGKFTLIVKQKKENIKDVKIEGGYGA